MTAGNFLAFHSGFMSCQLSIASFKETLRVHDKDSFTAAGIRIIIPDFRSKMSLQCRIPLENVFVNEVIVDEAFITSLSTSLNEKSKRKDDRLCHVRKDHDKLMDVVETFGSKVSIM